MTLRLFWLMTILAGFSLVSCGGRKSTPPGDAGNDALDAQTIPAVTGADTARADATADVTSPGDFFTHDVAGVDAGLDVAQDSTAQPLDAGLEGSRTPYDSAGIDSVAVLLDATDRNPDLGSDLGQPNLDADLGSATLSIAPSTSPLDLGQVDKGKTGTRTSISITNIGNATTRNLTLSASDPQFVLLDDHCTGARLATSASCQVGVALRPTQTGVIDGNITVTDGAGSQVSVAVAGIGLPYYLLAGAPPSFDFGNWWIDTVSPPQMFTILNAGTLPSGALAVSLQGSQLSVSDDTCAGVSLAPGDTCSLDVTYDPLGCSLMTTQVDLIITPTVGTALSIALTARCDY